MSAPITALIPAHNEAATIASVIAYLRDEPSVREIIVIDNNSTDTTAATARAAGARVVCETRQGMGHAFKAGCAAAHTDWVLKVDADLGRFQPGFVRDLAAARAPGIGLIKGAWADPRDPMPMTRLLVKPAVVALAPGLGHLRAPNTGIYLLNRALIAHGEMAGDYAVDIDAMLRIWSAGWLVDEVDIGEIENDPRDPEHYAGMAAQIMRFFLNRQAERPGEALIVLAQSAREVITGALGSLVRRARAGGIVRIYLTRAEPRADAALSAALAPFPTATCAALGEAESLGAPDIPGTARLICAPACLGAARHLGQRLGPDIAGTQIWEMATTGTAALDPGAGRALAQGARQAIGAEPGDAAAWDVFRPDAL